MRKLLLLKGLPASGKSTFAKELAIQGWLRVNKDELRVMLHGDKFSKRNEKITIEVRNSIIVDGLMNGASIVVDDTNLHPKHEADIRKMVDDFNSAMAQPKGTDWEKLAYKFEVKFFDVPVEECIKRDLARSRSVGEKVIRTMYRDFIAPTKEQIAPPVADPTLPWAILCDIDGTLAKMGHRGPFDWKLVGRDSLVRQVARTLERYRKDYKIILMSGRDGVCRPETEQWLKDYSVGYDGLFMRTENDNRKDSIVKRELYENHIAGKYNVEIVLDDRTQVVEMWRSLGLTCFQVAPGDF